MQRIDYTAVKMISPRLVLAHYNICLEEKNIAGERKLVGRCPIHTNGEQDKKRNHFQWCLESKKNPGTEGCFHCFSCGARGTVVDFVVLMNKIVKVEDVDWEFVREQRKLKHKFNWCPVDGLKIASQLLHTWFLANNTPSKPTTMAQVERKPVEPTSDPSRNETEQEVNVSTGKTSEIPNSDRHNKTWLEQWGKPPTYPKYFVPNEYLASRGIRPEVLKEFGIGFYSNPKAKSIVNDRILFPIHNQTGELLAFAARTTEDEGARYWFPPIEKFDRTLELYNLHRAVKEGKRVLVVEGFFGALNLWQNGYRCVVSLMGSNLSTEQAETLTSEFEISTFILDPDEAGQKLKRQVLETLLHRMPVRVIEPKKQADLMTAEELKALL